MKHGALKTISRLTKRILLGSIFLIFLTDLLPVAIQDNGSQAFARIGRRGTIRYAPGARRPQNRDERREHKDEARDTRGDYREDMRDADDREERRDVKRDYRDERRDLRRD